VLRNAMRWRGLAVLVVAVALAAGLAQTNVGHVWLAKAGLLERPASYTSLAFQRPEGLSEQLGSKRVDVGVSFVIRNAGSTMRDYQWSILLAETSHTRRVAVGNVRIESGHGVAISRSVKIVCSRGRVRIAVKLAQPAEFIDAWMACSSKK
jgi:hypothetical protein